MAAIIPIPGAQWEDGACIEFDVELAIWCYGDGGCPHLKDRRINRTERADGEFNEYEVATIPRAVSIGNEGGHCSTGICVDCLIAFFRKQGWV